MQAPGRAVVADTSAAKDSHPDGAAPEKRLSNEPEGPDRFTTASASTIPVAFTTDQSNERKVLPGAGVVSFTFTTDCVKRASSSNRLTVPRRASSKYIHVEGALCAFTRKERSIRDARSAISPSGERSIESSCHPGAKGTAGVVRNVPETNAVMLKLTDGDTSVALTQRIIRSPADQSVGDTRRAATYAALPLVENCISIRPAPWTIMTEAPTGDSPVQLPASTRSMLSHPTSIDPELCPKSAVSVAESHAASTWPDGPAANNQAAPSANTESAIGFLESAESSSPVAPTMRSSPRLPFAPKSSRSHATPSNSQGRTALAAEKFTPCSVRLSPPAKVQVTIRKCSPFSVTSGRSPRVSPAKESRMVATTNTRRSRPGAVLHLSLDVRAGMGVSFRSPPLPARVPPPSPPPPPGAGLGGALLPASGLNDFLKTRRARQSRALGRSPDFSRARAGAPHTSPRGGGTPPRRSPRSSRTSARIPIQTPSRTAPRPARRTARGT